jgi:hypothetical protein
MDAFKMAAIQGFTVYHQIVFRPMNARRNIQGARS